MRKLPVFLLLTATWIAACDKDGVTEPDIPNRAPVAVGAIPAQAIGPGETVTLDLSPWFNDPDGDLLAYSAQTSNAGLATASTAGNTLTIRAADQTTSKTSPETLPPDAADVYSERLDPENESDIRSLEALYKNRTAEATGNTALLTARVQETATITITARDPDGLTATQTFDVTVETVAEDNQAPQAIGAIPAQTVDVDQTIDVDAAPWFSDPDSDTLSYQAASMNVGVATVAASGSVVTVQGVAQGEAKIEIVASDPDGLTAAQTFDVTVREDDQIIVAFQADTHAAPEGSSVTLNLRTNAPVPSAVALRYALGVDADATTPNADASDYTDPAGGTLEIPAGSSSGAIEIPIDDDNDIEPTREVFTVTLSEPGAGDGYALGSPASATVHIMEGVCDRTPRVRDEIVRSAGLDGCADIDDRALAQIPALFLQGGQTPAKQGDAASGAGNVIASLREKDFTGLVNLRDLILSRNQLTGLPPNLFSDLTKLANLRLDNNRIETLPSGIFRNLSRLNELSLAQNRIDRLSKDVFAPLGGLVNINLSHNQIRELPAELFSSATQLEILNLTANQITELPAGIFLGLVRMKRIWLHDNPSAPIDFQLTMRRTDSENLLAPGPAAIAVHLAQGFPLTMEIPLSISGGTLSANSVVLEAGSESSAEVIVTRDANGQGGVQIAAGEIADLQPAAQGGVHFVLPDPLTLFGGTAHRPPVVLSQLPAMRFRVGDAPESLKISEYFRGPDGGVLTYAATAVDPNVVSAEVAGDLLTVRPQAGGSTKITVTATDANNLSAESVLLTSVREDRLGSFKIDLIYLDPEARALKSFFQSAANYWMTILEDTELPDVPLREELWRDCTDAPLQQPNPVDPIDDLAIAIEVQDFFGIGGGVAAAGVCSVREGSYLPVTGILTMDRADIPHLRESGRLEKVILHEMGHNLGIGTTWDKIDLLRNFPASSPYEKNTHFAGPLAIEAFDEAGGTNYPHEPKVPVDGNGAHWRLEVLYNELMTGVTFTDIFEPLSAITIQALADYGYTVNVDQAEAYALPGVVVAKRGGAQGIPYGDDILKAPIRVVDREGRTVRIIPPKE